MSKKRTRIISAILLLLILSLPMGWKIYRATYVKNVFDEIYYSRITSGEEYERKPYKPYHGNFRFMPQIRSQNQADDSFEVWISDGGVFIERYRENYLDEGDHLRITCYPKDKITEKKMIFVYSHLEESYSYTYYVDEKLLVYKSSDPENTEKKQFLFDIFLRDYFEALGWRSDYSMNNLGDFTFIDTTLEGNERSASWKR